MTDPVSLSARRWAKGDGSPANHSVREMLEAAIARLDAGEIAADHAILVYATEVDGVGDDGYMQAGSFSPYAQAGLIYRGVELLCQGG